MPQTYIERILRARVYDAGLVPGPVVSEVYLALHSDVRDFESNLPIIVIDTFGVDIDRAWRPNEPRPYRAKFDPDDGSVVDW